MQKNINQIEILFSKYKTHSYFIDVPKDAAHIKFMLLGNEYFLITQKYFKNKFESSDLNFKSTFKFNLYNINVIDPFVLYAIMSVRIFGFI